MVYDAEKKMRLERDLQVQKSEPPGSYGLCWKTFENKDGHPANCTKAIGKCDTSSANAHEEEVLR